MARHQPLPPLGSRRAGYIRCVPNEHMARALGAHEDVIREARKADNLRRFREAHPANDRFAGPPRHYRIGESKLDLFEGIAFWFLVGIAPALCVLAIIAVAK